MSSSQLQQKPTISLQKQQELWLLGQYWQDCPKEKNDILEEMLLREVVENECSGQSPYYESQDPFRNSFRLHKISSTPRQPIRKANLQKPQLTEQFRVEQIGLHCFRITKKISKRYVYSPRDTPKKTESSTKQSQIFFEDVFFKHVQIIDLNEQRSQQKSASELSSQGDHL